MCHKHLPGLWRRGAIFQYRIRVPADVSALLGKTHINRSLGTSDYRSARTAAHLIAIEIDEQFRVVREGGEPNESNVQRTFAVAKSPALPVGSHHVGPSLQDLWQRYLFDPASTRTDKSIAAYDTVRRLVLAVIDGETPAASVTRQHCREVLETLQGLPTNYQKRWPRLSPAEAVVVARKRGVPAMSAANINGYMEKFSGMFNWATKEEFVSRNPCRGLRVADPIAARDKRRPFSPDQLQRIFGDELFSSLPWEGTETDQLKAQPIAHRFVPLVAVYSGMRQNEICQLESSDISVIDDIPCFLIRPDASTGKRLKTASSERIVPVHPALIGAGLLTYWNARLAHSDVRLWPNLKLDRFGYASSNFSKWFARFLLATGAKEPRTAFHSLRHNFRDGLRAARVDREIANALGGWSTSASEASVGDIYGRGHTVAVLHEAISKVSYPLVPALRDL